MQRGARAGAAAAREALDAGAGAKTLLDTAAAAWANRAGGTSGALWGVALSAVGASLGDSGEPHSADVASGVTGAKDAIMSFGKAEVGDKTMVDALVPFSDTLAAEISVGADLATAWQRAADATTAAAAATADLLPRMGRARPHAEKSLGTPDAGAYSLGLIVQSIAVVLASHREEK